MKEHIGRNAFFDIGLPKDHRYDVPTFPELESHWQRAEPLSSEPPVVEYVPQNDMEKSAIETLMRYIGEMNQWERDCWQAMNPPGAKPFDILNPVVPEGYDPLWQER